MNTLDQVLETALKLPDEQQEMLIKILKKRYEENHRAQIARDAKQSLDDFHAGRFQVQSADEIVAELTQSLDEPA
ncbi:MAG: hypothetical protein AAFP20_23305 [Cyanobacteria bacterium J06614_10]